MLHDFWENFRHNLFKPLLLFFYMGFSIPLLGVPFEFPHVIYQGLTMYLLIAIGWKGGEELAELSGMGVQQALGFMIVGFITNFIIGCFAYFLLRRLTNLRKVDAATVAGYYGSDSAGTFATCVGVLNASNIVFAAYMPVMLAVMEVPGCLVALFLVTRLRAKGMDSRGNSPDEPGYNPDSIGTSSMGHDHHGGPANGHGHGDGGASGGHGGTQVATVKATATTKTAAAVEVKEENGMKKLINWELMHELFLNPGLYLLFGGIFIGCVSRMQGEKVTKDDDFLFVTLFQGALCLFLLEMGMTACKRLKDLRAAGVPFILFGILAPNVFATAGMFVAHGYSMALGQPFEMGTYVLFAVLCGAASYIAVPAIQRLAIPEASPTLPLAASLGLTFSYNVTIGIPVYIEIAKAIIRNFPLA